MASGKYYVTLVLWVLAWECASIQGEFENVECVTDLQQEDCTKLDIKKYYVEKGSFDGKCPGCEEREELGAPCDTTDRICAPGLKCDTNIGCVIDKDSCNRQIHEDVIYPPSCTPDGKFAPVQCKGDRVIGRCFCVNEDGKRIFGLEWRKDAKDMTCACSRKRANLEKEREDVSLHCKYNGNYELIQCDSGLCWCADEKTGDAVSVALPEDLVSQLPCYDPDLLGSQYTRVCESKAHAIAVVKEKLKLHGTTDITFEKVNCDYDGTYGVYQIFNGIAFCSWKDGSRLGSWQIEAGVSVATMDCNCARDTKYFEEADKTLTQSCAGNGNYLAKQQINGQVYCVDRDGFPLIDLLDEGCDIDCVTMTPLGCQTKVVPKFVFEQSKIYQLMYSKDVQEK